MVTTTYLGTESKVTCKSTATVYGDVACEFVSCTLDVTRPETDVEYVGTDFVDSFKYGKWKISGEVKANYGTFNWGDVGTPLAKVAMIGTPTAYFMSIFPLKSAGTPSIALSGVEFQPYKTEVNKDNILQISVPFRAISLAQT